MGDHCYKAEQALVDGITVIRLKDEKNGIDAGIIPRIGNRVFEMLVGGKNILHFPHDSPAALQGDRHLSGIPFLAPWANRMPDGFHANGAWYPFRLESPALRLDTNGIPIHGLLTASPLWEIVELGADTAAAHVTCRLDFWKYPDLMAVWPFAHSYEMTYRLAAGVLEVKLTISNLSAATMPVAVGFHPYFELPGVSITDAAAGIPVRRHVDTDSRLVATGDTSLVAFDQSVPLKDFRFDDGFTDLVRKTDGLAVFSVEGGGKRIEVAFGPKYQVAIVYAPPGQNYICFEPMSAVTNGINLAHEGKYPDLQTVLPGCQWTESFWIRPTVAPEPGPACL